MNVYFVYVDFLFLLWGFLVLFFFKLFYFLFFLLNLNCAMWKCVLKLHAESDIGATCKVTAKISLLMHGLIRAYPVFLDSLTAVELLMEIKLWSSLFVDTTVAFDSVRGQDGIWSAEL